MRLVGCHRLFGLLAAAALLGARPASADETIELAPARGPDEPHTLAQLGVGFLTLPGAEICLNNQPCTKGDVSIELDFWQLYRANKLFAIGAGASVGIKPSSDNSHTDGNIDRTHSRSYFLIEGQGRFYVVHSRLFEGWLGATFGGVVVSDRYSIRDDDDHTNAALIGPRATTLRTEGWTLGGLVGAQWSFAQNWAIGASARYMRWFLPSQPAQTVFLDRATVTGNASAVEVGVSCSYRIAL